MGSLAPNVHANSWQIWDEEFERFRGRKEEAKPKTLAANFGNCADIGKKKAMRRTPKKDEIFRKAAAFREFYGEDQNLVDSQIS